MEKKINTDELELFVYFEYKYNIILRYIIINVCSFS